MLAERYSVSELYLFGSTVRGDRRAGSDVDLLVEFNEPVELLHFIRLQQHLEKLLGCKVDLGTRRALKEGLRAEVLREAVRGMKAGQFSPIVETDFGYQLIFVEEIKETASRPLAQVEAEIQDILFRERVDERFVAWLSDLRKRSHIKVMGAP